MLADIEVRDHQAVLGAAVRLAGPAGPLTVTIPSGTQAGRTLRLRGKGIPGLGRATAGDLLLTVRITVPPALAAAERELYERLAELRGEGGWSAGRARHRADPPRGAGQLGWTPMGWRRSIQVAPGPELCVDSGSPACGSRMSRSMNNEQLNWLRSP